MSGTEPAADALRRRLELERLFGIREVYVGKKRAGRAAKPAREKRAAGGPGPGPGDAARARRRKAVEAARERTAEAAQKRAEATRLSAEAEGGDERPRQREFVIETLGGSQDELSLLSEAERAGIPHVSAEDGPNVGRLAELADAASGCARCGLAGGRNMVVFGEGDPKARLVFVGEAPGAEEDRTGRPFVGRAGKLLTKIIEAMGCKRADVYICNVLKCRPPGNRTPLPDEVAACSPFLHEQLGVIRPKAICALGGPATTTLLRTREGITRLRGRLFWYRGIPLMPTFHPAYLLRNPREKKSVWADMQKLWDFLESLG